MPVIKLKKPIEHDGKLWEEIDFDPSIDALEAFEAAIRDGKPEIAAMKALFAFDGDTPAEIVGKLRASDLQKLTASMSSGPFGDGSTAFAAGEPSPQT